MTSPSATPWFAFPETKTERCATVIGAGLAGVSIACHLQKRGWKVTLIDRHKQCAMATSGNPAGLIKPQVNYNNNNINSYYIKYFNYFIEYFENLLEVTPEIQHNLSGLSGTPNGATALSATAKPSAWLSPVDFCQAQLSVHPDINILYSCEIAALNNDAGRWQCISSAGETLSDTPVCVLAGGNEINFLLKNQSLPIEPLAGQVSLLSESAITPPVKQACFAQHYLIPLNDNSYVCGASHHRSACIEESQADHEANLAGLEKLLPHHHIDKTKIIGARTGVRAVSPDHLPIVGGIFDEAYYRSEYEHLHHGKKPELYAPAKYLKGLFVFSALGSHGIGSSPYLGKLLSALIDGSIPDTELQTLQLIHPARFLIRQLKRKPADRE